MFPDLDLPPPAAGPHRVRVFGHERLLASLRGAVARDRLAQSYLLSGPPAVGKRTVARWLAQLVMCGADDPAARPCGHCRACRLVAANGWADLHRTEVPLRIGAVRSLQHELALAPNEARHRVVIVADVELASPGAANSLLKTLEEPPSHALLVLTTSDPGAVLPTVRSRCQLLSLRPLPLDASAQALTTGWPVDEHQAALLSRLAGGRVGWAARAIEDEALLAARATWLDGLARARAADVPDRMALAADLARAKASLADGLAVWVSWWRDVLLAANGLGATVVNRDRAEEIESAARHYGSPSAVAFLRSLETALHRLTANAGPQLTLEVLLLEMP